MTCYSLGAHGCMSTTDPRGRRLPQRRSLPNLEGDAVSEVEQEQTQEHEQGDAIEGVPVEPAPAVESDDEEAEHEEQEHGEQPEAEAEPEQPQGLSEKELEKAFAKLDREAQRHQSRIQEIMGEDAAMLAACPMCDPLTPGFVMPTPATPERFPAVRAFMGDAQPVEWQQDPNTRTCLTCAGYGVVETGSKVEGQERLACTDCGGKGWQGSRAPAPGSTPVVASWSPPENGHTEAATPSIDSPEVAALKAKGYTVIGPVSG